eukprot:TRINITY_DN9591_c0_g1_i2.p1 TRINITY_DN9591_c0_g1~~TRINITY_DN9591_c0_g1_i2.p1  ORF type:complete len:416 (-),score=33.14 TRINITY_DN9591_c0_g1_i2:151-1398(-)
MSATKPLVIARFRPSNHMEGGQRCIQIKNQTVEYGASEATFKFDSIMDSDASQLEVFSVVQDIVKLVLDGYNGTILAYGQTGSGKTHTLIGEIHDEEQQGIVPRAVRLLSEGIIENDSGYAVDISVIEIYCEKIRDLLDYGKDNLQVKQDQLRGIYVENATEVPVSSEEQLVELMMLGLNNRAATATAMNANSSRSHCIVTIHVTKTLSNGWRQYGKLCLVDLAGSERQDKTLAEGQTIIEGNLINKSLSALGNVISALTDGKSSYVPYRDSKLTRVLQDSLGGNARMALLVCCSPCVENAAETLSTLRFGTRVQGITNTIQVNVKKSYADLEREVEQLKEEIERLKQSAPSQNKDQQPIVRQSVSVTAESQTPKIPKQKSVLNEFVKIRKHNLVWDLIIAMVIVAHLVIETYIL